MTSGNIIDTSKNKTYMFKIFLLIFISLIVLNDSIISQSVFIKYDTSSVQTNYAAGKLQKILQEKGYTLQNEKGDYNITLSLDGKNLTPEAYSILPDGNKIFITGGDMRGIIYGALSLAEDLRNGITLQNIKAKDESTRLHFRTIKFDLPWDTYRHSYALDLHQKTCADLNYWEAFPNCW